MPRLCLLIVSITAFISCAHAEERIETMIVTASRLPMPLDHVAASISVIDEREIDVSSSIVISDLLRTIPGLSISQSGGLGTATQVRTRGGEANQTLVLIDGIEVNDPAIGSEFDFAHLLTRGIEQIEVLRGPQSSLWGSDALGGVISVTTKRPTGPLRIDALAEGGSFGTRTASIGLGAAQERYSFAVHGSYLDTDGTNIAQRGTEDDGYDNATLSLTADFTPFDRMRMDMAYRHVRANTEFDPAPFPDFVPVDGDRKSKITQDYARMTLRWDTHPWTHSLEASLLDTENENFADGTRSSATEGERKKLTYQLSRKLTTRNSDHTLVFALEHEIEGFSQRGNASAFGDPNQRQSATSTGAIGEYRVTLGEELFLSFAGRFDDNDEFGNAHSWRITAARELAAAHMRLHANVGTGTKNPTFIERFGFTPDTFIGNPKLDPESSLGAEAGIRKGFLDGGGNVDLTVFYERLDDEIDGFFFDPGLGGFTAVNRDDKSRRRGLELSFVLEPISSIVVRGGYAFVDATQSGADGKSAREIRRPRHSGYVTLLLSVLDDRLDVYTSYSHVGARIDDDFATFPATRVQLDDYALVRIAASYAVSERISVFARVENVLDQGYQDVFGFDTPGFGAYAGIRVNTLGR